MPPELPPSFQAALTAALTAAVADALPAAIAAATPAAAAAVVAQPATTGAVTVPGTGVDLPPEAMVLVRQLLTLAGGFAVSHGYATAGGWEQLAGLLSIAIGMTWSVVASYRKRKAAAAAVAVAAQVAR